MYMQAKEKIERELPGVNTDKYGDVIKKPTADMLISLSEKYPELAKAIVEGKSFEECIKYCKPNSNTSDLEVYKTHGGSRTKILQRPPQSWLYVQAERS